MDLGDSSSNSICSSREYRWLIHIRVEYLLTIYLRTREVDVSHPSLNQSSSGIYTHMFMQSGPIWVSDRFLVFCPITLSLLRRMSEGQWLGISQGSKIPSTQEVGVVGGLQKYFFLLLQTQSFLTLSSKDGNVEWRENYLLSNNHLGAYMRLKDAWFWKFVVITVKIPHLSKKFSRSTAKSYSIKWKSR